MRFLQKSSNSILRLSLLFGLAFSGGSLLATNDAVITATTGDPSIRTVEELPLAAKSLLLDIVKTDYGYFAVGDRGHVLRSDDGLSWTQLKIDTRSTLTSIASVGDRLWVAGHDGVIFYSADRGTSWTRQRTVPWTLDDTNPAHGVPILDVYFADENNGFAIGAFSLLLRTSDGGATWDLQSLSGEPAAADSANDASADKPAADESAAGADESWTFSDDELELDDEVDPHLNAIAGSPNGILFIAGERGALFRSRNGGVTWSKLKLPYEGSMFGLVSWNENQIMAFGLRGNVFESFDGGQNWQQVKSGTSSTLMGGISLPNGGAVIVGNGGVVLQRPDRRTPFAIKTFQTDSGETPVLSGVTTTADNTLVLIGEKGAETLRTN